MRALVASPARTAGLLALLLPLLGASLPGYAQPASESAAVFLVRHAEKAPVGDDPALTQAGRQRSAELADLLQDAGIDAVYSTDFQRTRDTAEPLATRRSLPVQIYDWNEMQALAATLGRPGRRSLVVGHSDTTPELVGLLGGDPGAPIEEDGEYDRLYLVLVGSGGTVSTVLLRYGAPYVPDQSE